MDTAGAASNTGGLHAGEAPMSVFLRRLLGRPPNTDDGARASQADRSSFGAAFAARMAASTDDAPEHAVPYASAQALLAPHADLMVRMSLAYGLGAAAFDADLKPLIERYARYVHALPATPDNYFSSDGGLVALGLQTAFFSLQAADGQIFCGRATISERRELEPRWRRAAFIAGLCHELYRAVAEVVVTDADGQSWPSFLLPLDEWLCQRRATRFRVEWPAQASALRSMALLALTHIVPPPALSDLSQGNRVVVPHLMASIGGLPLPHEPNVLDALVRRCAAVVIGEDVHEQSRRLGRAVLGAHWGGHLLDAMQRLVRANPAWVPNTDKSRLWWGPEGLFMVWPQAAKDIVKLLEQDQLAGIPREPATLLQLLAAGHVIDPRPGSAGLWQIHPPGSETAVDAVRILSVTGLLADNGFAAVPLNAPLLVAPRAGSGGAPHPSMTPAPSPATPSSQPCIDLDQPAAQAPLPFDTTCDAAAAPAPALRLRAPKGLNPHVREAVVAIVASLHDRTSAMGARLCPAGVFVPLAQLEAHGLVAGMAVRALGQSRMLVAAGRTGKTVTFDVDGTPVPGVVVDAAFIEGLDPRAFATAGGG
jgi:conjugal transfer pilus assembly protein TraI